MTLLLVIWGFAVCVIPALLLFAWCCDRRRRTIARHGGSCVRCGYDPRGGGEVCPECGWSRLQPLSKGRLLLQAWFGEPPRRLRTGLGLALALSPGAALLLYGGWQPLAANVFRAIVSPPYEIIAFVTAASVVMVLHGLAAERMIALGSRRYPTLSVASAGIIMVALDTAAAWRGMMPHFFMD